MIDYYETKEHPITRKMVLDAYKKVKSNAGSAGVDGQSIAEFSEHLSRNLYKLWNRMTSGSYFPSSVKEVKIPKSSGGTRSLGIPTVEDRIAQQVVKSYLEPSVENSFHPDSYGYRPGRNAHMALDRAEMRCSNQYEWVVDLDIKGFFDNLDHDLLLKGVQYYTKEKWILLYISRWLKAGVMSEGKQMQNEKGTPQGGVISPLLANIFLHFAFDKWMEKNYSYIRFERYCDDIIVHARSEKQALYIKDKITERLKECKLELNEGKTQIVYCRNENHREKHAKVQFDFLGYTFRPRMCPTKTGIRLMFTRCMSAKSKLKVMGIIRKMNFKRLKIPIQELAKLLNPRVRGWINYYCKTNKWTTSGLWWQIHLRIIRWVMKIRKKSRKDAIFYLQRIYKTNPLLFTHWQLQHP